VTGIGRRRGRRTSAFGLNVGIKAGKIVVIAPPSRHESGQIYHRAGATALGHLRQPEVDRQRQLIY